MAKLKATPKNYAAAAEVLAGRDSVRLGNNTYLERLNGLQFIGVRLHNTYVVRFHENGQITLHTGGYRTATTKDRINEFITGRVYQKNHEWYYVGHNTEGALDWDHPDDFTEGYEVKKGLVAQ
jgi:hypothetical protein